MRPIRRLLLITSFLLPTAARAATLETVQVLSDIGTASELALSPGGAHLYVAERNVGIYAFDRDPGTGHVLFIDSEPSGICDQGLVGTQCSRNSDCDVTVGSGRCFNFTSQPSALTVSPDGACLYAASALSDSLAVFGRNGTTGALTLQTVLRNDHCLAGTVDATCATDSDCDTSSGAGDGSCLTGYDDPHGLASSPDDAHLYVALNGSDSLIVFARTGCGLSFVQRVQNGVAGIQGLRQAFAVIVDASGDHVYATGLFGNALLVFDRNAATGVLTEKQTLIAAVCTAGAVGDSCRQNVDCGPGGMCTVSIPALLGPSSLALAPGEAHLYVSNTKGVAVFDRDAGSGMVSLVDDGFVEPAGTFINAGDLVLTPDGRTLFASGTPTSTLIFDRDDTSGLLRESQFTTVNRSMVVSPDGAFAYGSGVLEPAVYAIHPTLVCSPMPLAGCRRSIKPGKGKIQIKDATPDKKDQLKWNWTVGAATTSADFGDPTIASSYVLCLYDASSASARIAFHLPAGGLCSGVPCWSSKATLKYKNKLRLPDGLEAALLKDGEAGKAKIQIKGKDSRLALPGLGLTPPVVVQLQGETGVCWDAQYSSPKKNTAEEFSASAD
jgi:6-phosphogluconolactonase (cycloisomerase 2 family)